MLFHFILSKIVDKITVRWVVGGKICIGQGALTQKQGDNFRLYWRVSILITELLNRDDLCVGGEGKSMLGVDAHIWRKLITCKTLKTSQHC